MAAVGEQFTAGNREVVVGQHGGDRLVQATIPPRVEYALTPLGVRVAAKLRDLIDLVNAELPVIAAAQASYDRSGSASGPSAHRLSRFDKFWGLGRCNRAPIGVHGNYSLRI